MSEDKVINMQKMRKTFDTDDAETCMHCCCNFCGRSESEVLNMVKGPGVNICSECIMIAVQYLILKDKMPSKDAQKILDALWTYTK